MLTCQYSVSQPELRVLIVDPLPLHCYCLQRVLDARFNASVHIVGKVRNLNDATIILSGLQVDVIVGTPVSELENMRDWQTFCRITALSHPSVTCVFLTDLPAELLKMFTPERARARTIVLKRNVPVDNFCAVLTILKSQRLPVHLTLAFQHSDHHAATILTKKELMILAELMKGKTLQQISAVCGISVNTLSHHKWSAMRKLGKKSSLQLMFLLQTQRVSEPDTVSDM